MIGANNLVIGMGEVGQGVFDVLRGQLSVFARDKDPVVITQNIDVLHIAFPYSKDFTKLVKGYEKLYAPSLVIIYSTVPIGASESLGAVHSPVEGKHPTIGLSIQNSSRWLGSSNAKKLKKATRLWEKFVPVRELPKADFTEWLKLRSTSKYGINIVWTNYEAQVTKELGMDYIAVKQFDLDYNNMYQRLGHLEYQRYILDPPEGKIGGHCVVPNAELLDAQYPSDMLKMIKDMQ